MNAAEAVRHPKRGKAHRADRSKNGWDGTGYRETLCGLDTRGLTRAVPVDTVVPEDRCLRCWPGSAVRA